MENKPITVVTITYNSSKYIVPLLKTLEVTDNSKFIDKIVIIENNSNEKKLTIKLIKEYLLVSKLNVKIISSTTNDGFAKSCNRGASYSESKYVLFINPDTELHRDSLGLLYRHAEKFNADIIGGVSEKNESDVHKTVVRHPNLIIGLFELTNLGRLFNIDLGRSNFYYDDIKNLYSSKKDIIVDAIGGAYLMVNLNSFQKIGGFDPGFFMYLEDVDLGVRANQAGQNIVFCPHSRISHIGGASSNNRHHIRHQAWFDSRRYYFSKHHSLLINLIIQPIFIVEEYILKAREFFVHNHRQ